jgi:hypothetical protein
VGRFEKPPVEADLTQQIMVRVESVVRDLVQSVQALSAQGPPVIPPYPAPLVNVEVPTETLALTLSTAMQEMFDAMPAAPVPPAPINLASPAVQSDEQLTAFLDATARQSEAMEAMREKLTNIISSPKSHFDGRLRTDKGMVSADNPLQVQLPEGGGGLTNTEIRATPLAVTQNGETVVDPNNSFDDLDLTANQILVGEWTEILDYSAVSFVLRASQISATDGAVVEFSDDTTSPAIRTLKATIIGTIYGADPIYVALPVQARYFRLKYTNGAFAGTFDAQTLLKKATESVATAPLGSSLNLFSAAQVVRAVLAGRSDGNTVENLSVDDDAFLRVNIAGQDTPIDIAPLAASAFTQVSARTLVNGGPTKLISTTLTSRSSIAVKNPSADRVVYIGTNPALTQTSSSFPLGAGETITLDLDSATDLYGLADDTDTAVDVRVAVVEVG